MSWVPGILASEACGFACLLSATVSDVRWRRLPNRMVLGVTAAGLASRLMTSPEVPWASLAACGATLGILGLIASRARIGWGDAKMIAAVTLLVPARDVVGLLLAIAIAGGVLSLAYMALRQTGRLPAVRVAPTAGTAPPGIRLLLLQERDRAATGEPMPYGVAIFSGVLYQLIVLARNVSCWPATWC